MPPVTPSRMCLPASAEDSTPSSPVMLGSGAGWRFEPLEVHLALGDLRERDGQRLGAEIAGLHERWDELAPALTELVVVGVDLAGSLGGQDDQGVAGVDPFLQVVDLRLDHGWVLLCGGGGSSG